MWEQIAEPAAVAWPLALTLASVAVAGRLRGARRRDRLNRALHELRRPLQALRLELPPAGPRGPGQLDLALAALAELDRELNGGEPPPGPRIVLARTLAEQAVARWRAAASACGRGLELRWRAGGSRVACDPTSVARALDNLIANSLEHGLGTIRVEGVARPGRLRLLVSDGAHAGAAAAPVASPTWPRRHGGSFVGGAGSARRGHGLGMVAEIAAEHGGRFAACRDSAGACAVIELPLAGG